MILGILSLQDLIQHMGSIKPRQAKETSKKEQVEEMFDNIAPSYDFLNRLLSARHDVIWRKKLVATIENKSAKLILDVATGTGDVALQIAKSIQPHKIIGLDLSHEMLEVARRKGSKIRNIELEWVQGDSEHLNYPDNTFDAITAAFGVRNFENLEKGLSEMLRVTKPSGTVSILEFTKPRKFPIKQAYNIYFKNILPLIGRIKSGDPDAYTYLFNSVQQFPEYEHFTSVLSKLGFREVGYRPLTFGICCIYTGRK